MDQLQWHWCPPDVHFVHICQVLSQFCWPPLVLAPQACHTASTWIQLPLWCEFAEAWLRVGHTPLPPPPPKKEKTTHPKHTNGETLNQTCVKVPFSLRSAIWCVISCVLLIYFRYCLEWLCSEVTGGDPSPVVYICQMVDLVTSTQPILYFMAHYSCQMCIRFFFLLINFSFALVGCCCVPSQSGIILCWFNHFCIMWCW